MTFMNEALMTSPKAVRTMQLPRRASFRQDQNGVDISTTPLRSTGPTRSSTFFCPTASAMDLTRAVPPSIIPNLPQR